MCISVDSHVNLDLPTRSAVGACSGASQPCDRLHVRRSDLQVGHGALTLLVKKNCLLPAAYSGVQVRRGQLQVRLSGRWITHVSRRCTGAYCTARLRFRAFSQIVCLVSCHAPFFKHRSNRGTMDLNPERRRDAGRRIEVYWDGDGVFYRGTVVEFSVKAKKHTILYDDGDVEKVRFETRSLPRQRLCVCSATCEPVVVRRHGLTPAAMASDPGKDMAYSITACTPCLARGIWIMLLGFEGY